MYNLRWTIYNGDTAIYTQIGNYCDHRELTPFQRTSTSRRVVAPWGRELVVGTAKKKKGNDATLRLGPALPLVHAAASQRNSSGKAGHRGLCSRHLGGAVASTGRCRARTTAPATGVCGIDACAPIPPSPLNTWLVRGHSFLSRTSASTISARCCSRSSEALVC